MQKLSFIYAQEGERVHYDASSAWERSGAIADSILTHSKAGRSSTLTEPAHLVPLPLSVHSFISSIDQITPQGGRHSQFHVYLV
ncbi:hypothetical protein KDK_57880 [Dictyobacter kobayashii]|uniref:Uncharacterized protein n=1 Tax=Dictyobacter kobayashii TaxID=2014872 RepID=A0A402ASA0_9CHLR|nr:hypothetical protein KDK_57880 [Dictyobacter kobayashii]